MLSTTRNFIDLVNNPEFMARAEKLECLFFQFEFAVKLCCCPSTPYSALLPIVQCVRNGVNGIIEQGWLDKLFNPNITKVCFYACAGKKVAERNSNLSDVKLCNRKQCPFSHKVAECWPTEKCMLGKCDCKLETDRRWKE